MLFYERRAGKTVDDDVLHNIENRGPSTESPENVLPSCSSKFIEKKQQSEGIVKDISTEENDNENNVTATTTIISNNDNNDVEMSDANNTTTVTPTTTASATTVTTTVENETESISDLTNSNLARNKCDIDIKNISKGNSSNNNSSSSSSSSSSTSNGTIINIAKSQKSAMGAIDLPMTMKMVTSLLSKELEEWIWQDNRHFLQDRNIFEHTYFK